MQRSGRTAGGNEMSRAADWMRPTDDRPSAPEVDLTRPSVARVYDYVLGGKDNFAVDRAACEGFLRLVPEARQVALDNRSVLRRAVRSEERRVGKECRSRWS